VIRELTFLTVPDTQLCDVIVAQQDRADAAEAFARALIALQSDWDVMRLEHLNSDSFAGMDLRVALAEQGLRGQVVAAGENPYLFLDTTWDAYHQTRSRRFKKANNLVANRLQRMGAVTIDWLAPGTGNAADVARAIEVIRGVSARSWKVATGNSLDHPGPGAFIRRLSELAHRRGWLSVWTLSLDGVPIAMEYQLVANGCVFALRSDFDATIEEQASPGSYLSRQLTERLFGGGLRRYFMGPGKNPYKYRWSQAADPRFAMTVYGRTLRGRTLRAWEGSLKPAARALRDRIGRKSATLPAEQSDGADVSSDQGH
jgi:CelD/BcsL family acetyltransferase involved in cellulose biosynthesis